MPSTSYKACGTASNDNRWGGTVEPWATPSNATTDNGTTTSQDTDNTETSKGQMLYCRNFGFTSSDVPSGAKVDTVRFRVKRRTEANVGNTTDLQARAVGADGHPVGTNKASSTAWATTFEQATYEFSFDDTGLLQADVLDADFGFMLATTASTSTNKLAEVDFVECQIDYTASAEPLYVEGYAGTVANDSSIGDDVWLNPTNAQGAPDGTDATCSVDNTDDQSQALKATNFGLSLPAGATPVGVHVFWKGRSDTQASGGDMIDNASRLVIGGTIGATDKAKASTDVWLETQNTPAAGADEWRVYGGVADTWGETLTESICENVGFGAALSMQTTSTTNLTASIDACKVRVYYTVGGTTHSGAAAISGTGALTCTAGVKRRGVADLTGTGALSLAFTHKGIASLTGTGALTATGSMVESVTRSPSSAANSGTGTAWSNPTNVFTSNDSRATCALNRTTTNVLSQELHMTGFGFSVSDFATTANIVGVRLRLERSQTSTGIRDNVVQMIKAGSASGNNKADTSTAWPAAASEAYVSYGGISDLWGNTLSGSDVHASNWGFLVKVNNVTNFNNSTAQIDHAEATVYFVDSVVSATAALTASGSLTATAGVTRKGTAALSATGAINAVPHLFQRGVADLSGSGSLTTVGKVKSHGVVALTGTGTISVSASLQAKATVALTGTGTLSASASASYKGIASLSGSGSVTTVASLALKAAASLTGNASLSCMPHLILHGVASLTATGALVTAGAVSGSAIIAISGTATLTATAWAGHHAAASLSGTGSVAVSASASLKGAAVLSGVGSLAVSGRVTRLAAASLTGTSTLSAAGKIAAHGVASLSGIGTLTVETAGLVKGTASLSGTGSVESVARLTQRGIAGLTGNGTISAVGKVVSHGLANLTGTGTVSVVSGVKVHATVPLSGTGSVSITAGVTRRGVADLSGTGSLVTSAKVSLKAEAILTGTGALSVTGSRVLHAQANITGTGSLTVTAKLISAGLVNLAGSASLVTNAKLILGAQAGLSGSATLTAAPHITRHAAATLQALSQVSVSARIIFMTYSPAQVFDYIVETSSTYETITEATYFVETSVDV